MELRDFLIRIKIGTNFSIKKQYQIYQSIVTSNPLSIIQWINETDVLKENDKLGLMALLHDELLTAKIHENEQNGGIITIVDPAYPLLLSEIYCPPTVLFYRGKLSLLAEQKLIALVGARLITDYGRQAINCLIPGLVTNGLTTVSGLAKGVDSAVHQLTLNNKGKTIAVIGNGLDITYPKSNIDLQCQIEKVGLIISEYPKGSKPLRHHFVERNRIIAGITNATCIIEAKQKSGSLITAQFALTENRNVLAIPGSIFSETCRGTNELIAAGARPLIGLSDILEEVESFT